MLPISAIVGVSTVGYLLDQAFREKNFNDNNQNSDIPVENIDSCADQYPWNFVESFEDVQKNNEISKLTVNSIPNNILEGPYVQPMVNNEPSPLTPQYIQGPNKINAINNAGNPPPDYLINTTERPVKDFTFNNMVPFFRGSTPLQDMRGTGVPQGNFNSNDFNLGNDDKTPNNTWLSLSSGRDDTYFHKREAPSFFSPLEQRDRNTIPGKSAEAERPIRDRYTTSILTKNDEAPFEQIKVGPGINIDPSMPNGGLGFNSGLTTQIKPNNVGASYLTQLPGRVAGTKYQASNLPTALPGIGPSFNNNNNSKSNNNALDNYLKKDGTIDSDKIMNNGDMYGVPQKKVSLSTELTLERRPLTATPGLTQAQMHYSNFVLPTGTDKRATTNVEFGQSIKI